MICDKCGGNTYMSTDQTMIHCDTCHRTIDDVTGFVVDVDNDSKCTACGTQVVVLFDGSIICPKCYKSSEYQDINDYDRNIFNHVRQCYTALVPTKYYIKDDTLHILFSDGIQREIKHATDFLEKFLCNEDSFVTYKKTDFFYKGITLTIGKEENIIEVGPRCKVDKCSFTAFIHNIYSNIQDS